MCIDFNPRLREGGDIICIVGNSCIVNFNPRLREGGDKIDILFPPNKRYFNPRLREGGDVLWILLWILWITISIHASAKEATSLHMLIHLSYLDFNPRLREGGDNGWLYIQTLQRNFNPRLREGGDLSKDNLHLHHSLLFQSTPPRRRRLQIPGAHIAFVDFNPRLREGGDIKKVNTSVSFKFQSTPPRRRRRIRV